LKLAVFVDGCFWHGCTMCRTIPRTRARFWREKIEGNKLRDRRITSQLRRAGWTVIRVKECGVSRRATIDRISRAIEMSRRAAA
jgi:DNA mismatch endonuclease (patch repair protein)